VTIIPPSEFSLKPLSFSQTLFTQFMAAEDIDKFIADIWALEPYPPGVRADITEQDVAFLCDSVIPIFKRQPVLLELKAPITIIGDTHGQLHDTFRIFQSGHGKAGDSPFLFLGDYVDRGRNSIENLCLLLAYKIKYPDSFWMLRGNHECSYINRLYGFWDDCMRAWPSNGTDQWKRFGAVFNYLPIAAVIEQKIFCVHGGLSPHLHSMDDIRNIERPSEVPEEGLLCDLVWSDPDPEAVDWQENERGTSVCFGQAQVEAFLAEFQFDLVCRAHQAVMEGYEFPFRPDQSLITLFSAPNYCYEFENKGAILHVDARLYCSFVQLDPRTYLVHIPDEGQCVRPGTPPRTSGGSYTPATVSIVANRVGGQADDDDDESGEEDSKSGSDDERKPNEVVKEGTTEPIQVGDGESGSIVEKVKEISPE
jgi:serine/threonine-protein phosphatase PP1 catalytic subunit